MMRMNERSLPPLLGTDCIIHMTHTGIPVPGTLSHLVPGTRYDIPVFSIVASFAATTVAARDYTEFWRTFLSKYLVILSESPPFGGHKGERVMELWSSNLEE